MGRLDSLRRRSPTLAAAALLVTAGGFLDGVAAAALPAGLDSPDHGVVCQRERQTCYDRYGPSIGLTEVFLGRPAAERLTAILREIPAHDRLRASFSPADGVECVRETGPCRVDDQPDAALSAVLYGPWPARAEPGTEAPAIDGNDAAACHAR
jgi:Fels-1 prophage protein